MLVENSVFFRKTLRRLGHGKAQTFSRNDIGALHFLGYRHVIPTELEKRQGWEVY